MFLLHIVKMSDKVIIIADTRCTQRRSEREVDPMLCHGDLAVFCNNTAKLECLRLWAHERTPGIPRNVEDLETVEFADVLGAIAEGNNLTRCAQVCFAGTEDDQAERHARSTIDEVLEDQDEDEKGDFLEEADQEADLLHHIPLLGHPESENERLASWLRLPGRAHACNIYPEKHSCRCYVLFELHKTISMLPRPIDVRDATTKSRELKHTKCDHLDPIRSITMWDSMCSRSLTQSACASRS